MIRVLRPGPLTTVQDLGRPGHAHQGVPRSGAMDDRSYREAQRALGNDESAGALEVTLNRLELEFLDRVPFVVCGMPGSITLDGRAVEPGAVLEGLHLQIRPGREGARSYVAFVGAIDVPLVMGSRSTYLPAGFGGLEGRQLRAGDLLNLTACRRATRRPPGPAGERLVIRTLGFSGEWRVDPRSDRMGVRFTGGEAKGGEQLSRGAFPGLIQLPPDGTAIALGPDAQTLGGYAIGGCVISADLWKLGQLLPGERVRFEAVTRQAAVRASARDL